MPAYKGTKELGSLRSKVAGDHARSIDSRVNDYMSSRLKQGKEKGSMKGRQVKVGDTKKTKDADYTLRQTLDFHRKAKTPGLGN